MVENQPVVSAPKVIIVPQDPEKSSTHSFFHDDESMSTQTNQESSDIILIKSMENHESTISGQI